MNGVETRIRAYEHGYEDGDDGGAHVRSFSPGGLKIAKRL